MMFRSIRWRLVASFVLITLLTASVMGVLGFSLIKQYIERQETGFFNSNAEAVARQALPLMWPVPHQRDLIELVNTASFLGNVRVRVLDARQRVLADSGAPSAVDQFLWVRAPDAELRAFESFIINIPSGFGHEPLGIPELHFNPFDELPPETIFRLVQRVPRPWGNRVTFDEQPELLVELAAPRSGRVLTIPIGDADDPLGYVELREGPNFGSEALDTTAQAFLLAGVGSVLLAVIVGLLVARRLSAPLRRLTRAASQMNVGNLAVRAPQYGQDEIGQLARQFNQMAERLETSFARLATERDTLRRFIADASHELRTPITALKNFNELLQGKAKDDPDARVEFLAESQNQLDRLQWITQNLLNLSRLDAGLTALNVESYDGAELLETVVAPFKVQAQEKDVSLVVNAPQPALQIKSDRVLIELALSNLIDNALKFTPNGGQVSLGAGQSEGGIRIWVRDNGAGIEREDLPHIFERFYRGRNTGIQGSGLGLAMVQSVVHAHGGSVSVESEVGAGSHFVIELPHEIDI